MAEISELLGIGIFPERDQLALEEPAHQQHPQRSHVGNVTCERIGNAATVLAAAKEGAGSSAGQTSSVSTFAIPQEEYAPFIKNAHMNTATRSGSGHGLEKSTQTTNEM